MNEAQAAGADGRRRPCCTYCGSKGSPREWYSILRVRQAEMTPGCCCGQNRTPGGPEVPGYCPAAPREGRLLLDVRCRGVPAAVLRALGTRAVTVRLETGDPADPKWGTIGLAGEDERSTAAAN